MEHGLILDRYRPLADLGEGGHGSVVLAYDTRMARRVAIKRLPIPTDEFGRLLSKRGLGEARTGAMLNHPSIVTVHEWDTEGDEAFLIMEHVDGLSLGDVLDATDGPLDIHEVAAVVDAVADALTFAHANGVLHLDLKPDNVLVTRDGRVKVADFGVAALTGQGGHASGLGGTLGYMPLEQIVGEALDVRTDEWAFAALVYELLTGTNPYSAHRADDAILRIEIADAPPPSQANRHLPSAIDRPLMTALAARRAGRYPSVAEFADGLEPHLGDPGRGRASLGRLVTTLVGEDAEQREDVGVGLWDRLSSRGHIVTRAGAAAGTFWCAYSGLIHLPIPPAARWAAIAVTTVCGAIAPGLGLALGFAALVVAEAIASGPWIAVLVFAALTAYWWLMGRRGLGYAVAPILSPFFALARTAFSLPMLLGFAFQPWWAALSSALCAALIITTSAAYGGALPFLDVSGTFVTAPWHVTGNAVSPGAVWAGAGPYIVIAAWAAAGAVMSFMSRRGTRAGAVGGIIGAMAWIVVGYMGWGVLDPGLSVFDPAILSQTAGSLILMALVIAAGPPVRGDED